jgi:hypothetical protein
MPDDVPAQIESLIRTYREQRASPQESFRTFIERLAVCDSNRQSLAQLQQVLHVI